MNLLRIGAAVVLQRPGAAALEIGGKAALVLAWVALEGHAERRRLASVLWPESAAGQGRNNLRVLVHRINQRAGGELLAGAEQLAVDPSQAQLELHDTQGVLAALQAGGAQHCELLAASGIEAEAGEELQAWLEAARQRHRRLQLSGLSQALAQAQAEARHEHAAALARACVQLEPLSEHWHRQLMDTLVRGGDRAAALGAYEDCKATLRRQLGVLPDLQTRTVQLRILQEQAQGPGQGQTPEADGLSPLGGAARYTLVEREGVLAEARAALGQGLHLIVQGEPGVGKTRLLRHLAAGAQVEQVALRSGARGEAYAAIAQLLQEVQPRRAPRIGTPEQIELARLAPLAFAGVKPSEAALSAPRLHAALRHWVQRLGQAGVQVLVIDDVHYADAASQAALAALLEPAPDAATGAPALLLAQRSGESDAVLDEAAMDAQLRHRARRIELPRLSLAGVQALLEAMDAGRHAAGIEALAAQLLKRTGGNPLFVIELAQHSLEQGEQADEASLQALLGSRLKGCSERAQQLATVAAVAAEDFTVELAVAVTGQPALGLMPAWNELQRRGLFAEHGLAHDLVRESALGRLPQAIRQMLHRQVAAYLEGQGLQGAPVLRHWLAAEDFDHALPHAVHQLHASSAAGLPTSQQEMELLGLLERTSDAVLLDNLWVSAEINVNLAWDTEASDPWPRLRALRLRVEGMPPSEASAGWIAFEASRDRYYVDRSFKGSYAVLAPAVDRMPQQGIERAHAELLLSFCSFHLTGNPKDHVQRARRAVQELPDLLPLLRLRMQIATVAAVFLDPVAEIRSLAARRRAGRRRGDLALVADTMVRMAFIHGAIGSYARSFRHHYRAAPAQSGDDDDLGRFQNPTATSVMALCAGWYGFAQRLLTIDGGALFPEQVSLFLALLRLRLGDGRQAGVHASRIDADLLRRASNLLHLHAHVRAELALLDDRDPVATLSRDLERVRELGMGGTGLDLMVWEITLRTKPAPDRLGEGEALLSALRRNNPYSGRFVRVLLEVAEARAGAGAPEVAALAAEAARLLRRGYSALTLYLPEGLLRCARLIHADDAREAAALIHVARRWVRQAQQHVPADAQQSFAQNVAVNRLLLGEDESAVYTGPLR